MTPPIAAAVTKTWLPLGAIVTLEAPVSAVPSVHSPSEPFSLTHMTGWRSPLSGSRENALTEPGLSAVT